MDGKLNEIIGHEDCKKKVLPVTYPPITTFPPYANTLAVLCNYEEALPWIYSHYIQTTVVDIINRGKEYIQAFTQCFFGDFDTRRIANTIADCVFLNRENCPLLNVFEVPNSLINSMGMSIVDVVKNLIDSSMYFYGYVDVSKIRDYRFYGSEEFAHEIFIHGYDDSKGVFHYADFPNNIENKYKFSECSYTDFEDAFHHIEGTYVPIVKSFAAIQYVLDAPFGFDYNYVRDSIFEYTYPDTERTRKYNDYIHSFLASDPNLAYYWIPKVYMGTDVYHYFRDYIEYEFNNDNNESIDPRLFHAMYDHKEMMILRLKYLIDKGYLSSDKAELLTDYNKVRDNALGIRNLVLKYNVSNNDNTVTKIFELLDTTRTLEIEMLKGIFDFDMD